MVAFKPDVSVLFCTKLMDFSNLVLGAGGGGFIPSPDTALNVGCFASIIGFRK